MTPSSRDSQYPLLDTHCHIDLYERPNEIVQEVDSRGVYTIAVTNTPSVFPHTCQLVANSKFIRPALGLHPELVVSRHAELPLMWEYFPRTRYIGEVGLDYSRDKGGQDLQRRIFSAIVERCYEYGNKILTVHSRRAEADVVQIIGDQFPGQVILHWYSGSLEVLEKAVDYGFYFSINPAMTRSRRFQSLLDIMPMNRILTETDGPFVRLSKQVVHPHDCAEVLRVLANARNVAVSLVRKQVYENFKALLESQK